MSAVALRLLTHGLTLVLALSVAAPVAPARTRDRGSRNSRVAPSRSAAGCQRWDLHHDGCELPLHLTAAEWHTAAGGWTSSSEGILGGSDDLPSALDVTARPCFALASTGSAALEPSPDRRAGAALAPRGRAPPLLL